GVLRHVRIVDTIATHTLPARPAVDLAQVLFHPVGEHLRTRPRSRPFSVIQDDTRMRALRYEAARIDVEAQEPALDRAVPQGVCASRMKSERVAELRVAGEDRGLPTDELLAQTRAKLGIERLQLRCGSKALAIRRIRAQQS